MSELKVGDKRVCDDNSGVITIKYIGESYILYTYDVSGEEFSAHIKVIQSVTKPYKEPVKMVKWYRPKVIWNNAQSGPQFTSKGSYFGQDKRSFSFGMDVKVVEWDEIELPENWEDC